MHFIREKLIKCIYIAMTVLFAIIFVQIILGTKGRHSFLYSTEIWRIAVIFISVIFLLTMIARIDDNRRKMLFYAICVVWIVFQIVYVYSTYTITSSDAWIINYYAYMRTEEELADFFYLYFGHYQNNIGLAFILSVFYRVMRLFFSCSFEQTWLILAGISALMADVAILFTVLFSRYYAGKKYDCFTLLFACVLIGMSEEGIIFYTDIASLWTVPCFFCLLSMAGGEERKTRRYAKYIYMGTVVGVGTWLKPQIFICFISLICVSIICRGTIKEKVLRIVVVGVTSSIVMLGLKTVAYNWYIDRLPDTYADTKSFMEDNKFPMLHWVNMGLNENTLGAYDEGDVTRMKEIIGYDDKMVIIKESISDRLTSHSIAYWLQFVDKKIVYSLQNGSFSSSVGIWKNEPINTSQTAQKIQAYFDPVNENYFKHFGVIVQCVYYTCFGGLIITTMRQAREDTYEDDVILVGVVALFGTLLFLMLFERNVRYFYSYIPLMIVLGVKGIRKSCIEGES